MADILKENPLAELLRKNDGFISIKKAVEFLGPQEYTRCLVDLIGRDDEDDECADLYYQGGDSATGQPTHICFLSAFMDSLRDRLDGMLEEYGVLSPRTKGVKVI